MVYWLILAVLFCLLSIVFVSYRYVFLFRYINEKLPLTKAIVITFTSQVTSYVTPFKIGTLSKPFITRLYTKIPIKKSFLVCGFEQIMDVAWQLILIPVLLFIIGRQFITSSLAMDLTIIAILLGIIILSIFRIKFVISFFWKFKILIPKFIKKRLRRKITKSKINLYLDEFLKLGSNKKLLIKYLILIGILIFTQPLILYATLRYFEINLNYLLVVVFYWTSFIVGRISGIPVGLGTRDASLVTLIVTKAIPLKLAIKAAIFYRVIAMVPVIIIGLLPLVFIIKLLLKRRQII